MKKTKLIFVLLSVILMSCNDIVRLQDNFISVESVKSVNDSSYEVHLHCTYPDNSNVVYFNTSYRYQAGDTLWSESQLKKHDNKFIIELGAENKALKDSAFFYRVSLGNKIEDLNKQIKDLQI